MRPVESRRAIAAAVLAVCACAASCSRRAEPTPAAPPPSGIVEGRVVESGGDKPIQGVTVALCEQSGDAACTLRAARSATTDASGGFSIRDVAPGRYAIACLRGSRAGAALPPDGTLLEFGARREINVPAGTVLDIGNDGRALFRGPAIDTQTKLVFQFDRGKLQAIEVRAGETARAEVALKGV